MTRIVVIDWDNQELRAVVGEMGRKGLVRAECIALTWDAAEQQGLAAGAIDAVQFLLEGSTATRGRGVLLARRQHLDNFRLTAPPSTDDELQELAANYLVAELGASADDVLHDYVTLDDEPSAPRRVAISSIKQSAAMEYRELGAKLRLSKARLGLRADGAATLATRLLPPSSEPTLVVVANAEELDFVVVNDKRLVYWRNVYCSPAGDSQAFRKFVSTEAIRTMAVAEDSLAPDQHVGRVAIFLGSRDDDALLDALQDAVERPVLRLEPRLDGVELLAESTSDVPGRFAPLLGALVQEAAGERPSIDFFDLRVAANPHPNRRPLLLAALGVVTAVALGGYLLYERVAEVETAAASLTTTLKGLQKQIKQQKPDADTWKSLETWEQSHIIWLDELRDLSLRFPPPGTAVLLDFAASPNSSGGAVIRLSGKARDPSVVTELDGALRDEHRNVLSRNLQEQSVSPDDPMIWRFESTITTKRRSPAAYREALQESDARSKSEGL